MNTDHSTTEQKNTSLAKTARVVMRNLRSPRQRVKLIALAGLLAFGSWQFYEDRAYWQAVWQQRTTSPNQSPHFQANAAAGHRVEYSPAPMEFDLSMIAIPRDEVLAGGPPKDGIPALTRPKFVLAEKATYLGDEDRVIGLVSGDQAKAYPLKILNYHEIINDSLGDLSVAVTYCPLCDSCAVFDRKTKAGVREFGVSGLLYNSNILMYDRGLPVESLWSQVMTRGVSGPAANQSLSALPLELTTWKDWRARHAQTMAVSSETGHQRDYERRPYTRYFSTPQLMFPAKPSDSRLPAKARVLGVWAGSQAKTYPESLFSEKRLRIEDTIDGKRLVIEFNPQAKSMRVVHADEGIQWMYSLWFAWHAFHPDAALAKPAG